MLPRACERFNPWGDAREGMTKGSRPARSPYNGASTPDELAMQRLGLRDPGDSAGGPKALVQWVTRASWRLRKHIAAHEGAGR